MAQTEDPKPTTPGNSRTGDESVGMDPRFAEGSDREESPNAPADAPVTSAEGGAPDVVPKAFILGADVPSMMVSNKTWVVPYWSKVAFFWGAVAMMAGLISHKVLERMRYEEILVDTVMDPVPMNQPAANFSLTDGEGGPQVTLAALKGRYVFVNFWATWCPPCREVMPSMEFLARKYGRDVAFLAVSVDEDWNEVKKFFGKEPPTFRVLWDPKRQVTRAYGTEKFPESYLVNPQGRVVAKFVGPRDWNNQASEEYFRRLLAKGG